MEQRPWFFLRRLQCRLRNRWSLQLLRRSIQAVAKITEVNTSGSTNNVTKYYTGTQIFAVGTGSVGDVVVRLNRISAVAPFWS